MAKFIAKLTGESDGFVVTRDFADEVNAIDWLQRGGLADFDDQLARGEVFTEGGTLVWTKSHLQTPEQADRERRLHARRFLASLNITAPKRQG